MADEGSEACASGQALIDDAGGNKDDEATRAEDEDEFVTRIRDGLVAGGDALEARGDLSTSVGEEEAGGFLIQGLVVPWVWGVGG
jgi:hypothetical protein